MWEASSAREDHIKQLAFIQVGGIRRKLTRPHHFCHFRSSPIAQTDHFGKRTAKHN